MDALSFDDFKRVNGISELSLPNGNSNNPVSWMMVAQDVYSEFMAAQGQVENEDGLKAALKYMQCIIKGMAGGVSVFDGLREGLVYGIYGGNSAAADSDGFSKENLVKIYENQITDCMSVIKDKARDTNEKYTDIKTRHDYIEYVENKIEEFNSNLTSRIANLKNEIADCPRNDKEHLKELQAELADLMETPEERLSAVQLNDKKQFTEGFVEYSKKISDYYGNIMKDVSSKLDKIEVFKILNDRLKNKDMERDKDNIKGLPESAKELMSNKKGR